jgi:prevent-host-death family protein
VAGDTQAHARLFQRQKYVVKYIFRYKKEAEMQQIIGVTELQRHFRSIFDEVTKKRISYILTRGSRPEAVLIPYEEYQHYLKLNEENILANFDTMTKRLGELNAKYPDEEVVADVEKAVQEVREARKI